MSFTEQVKNELARVVRPDKESRSGELLALLRMGGAIVTGAQGKKGVEFSTGNSAVARRVLVCLKKDFNLMPSAMVRQGRKLRKKNVYTLTVRPSADSLRFLGEMGLDPLMDIRDAGRLVSAEERRSYLAGAFLGGGTVSRPQGDYHLELVTQSLRFAGELIAVMRSFKLNARMTDRKNDYIVYIKGGDDVSSFLQIVGAANSYMDFESVRVVKDMRNRVNRQVNCETANINKTVSAAVKQINDIVFIRDTAGFESLPPGLAQIARARLEKPEATLKELGEDLEPPVGKSGVNHRLRKLCELAERLREEQGAGQ